MNNFKRNVWKYFPLPLTLKLNDQFYSHTVKILSLQASNLCIHTPYPKLAEEIGCFVKKNANSMMKNNNNEV